MVLKELTTKEEMLKNFDILHDFYPSLTYEEYSKELDQMIPHNYGQVGIYDGNICMGMSGFWIGTKLWCGKYLEFDNVIVAEEFRRKGIAKKIFSYLKEKAIKEGCTMAALDSYRHNTEAHKFFEAEGFDPKGYHFINVFDKSKIR